MTYDVMEPDTPGPHTIIPLTHQRDDILLKVLHEQVAKHRVRTKVDFCQFTVSLISEITRIREWDSGIEIVDGTGVERKD